MRIKTRKKKFDVPRSLAKFYPDVEFVQDATEEVNISVQEKDCKVASKGDPTECALAKAAKREFKADHVIIGIGTSYLIKGKQAVRFDTPHSVSREIISFDRHGDFASGDYYLKPKSKGKRLHSRSRVDHPA